MYKNNMSWPPYSSRDAYEDGRCAKKAGQPESDNPFLGEEMADQDLAEAFRKGYHS